MKNQELKSKLEENVKSVSDPKEMLHKYIASDLYRICKESFLDADSGEVVDIKQKEIICKKGILIDKNILSQITFFLQSGDITTVLISDQQRVGFEVKKQSITWIATVRVGSKKRKIILYAKTLNMAKDILLDYLEQTIEVSFFINSIKENEYIEIIEDTDVLSKELTTLTFYYILTKIFLEDENEDYLTCYIVRTFDTERAIFLIQEEVKKNETRKFKTLIEEVKILNINEFIPVKFSNLYNKNEKDE